MPLRPLTVRILVLLGLITVGLAAATGCSRDSDSKAPIGDGDEEESENVEVSSDGDSEATEEVEAEPEWEAREWPLYSTDGGRIRDKQGRQLILHGVNVTNVYKYAPKDDPAYLDAKGFANIADLGFNAVRLLVNWHALEPQDGVFDRDYLEAVKRRVRMAIDNGLYVLLDMHQDLYGIGFGDNGMPAWTCDAALYASYVPKEPWVMNYYSEEVKACFDRFWASRDLWVRLAAAAKVVAEEVRDNEGVFAFDTFNEPFWGSADSHAFEAAALSDYHQTFAAALTETLPERLIFFEPTILFNSRLASDLRAPGTAYSGVFAPHYYHTMMDLVHKWSLTKDEKDPVKAIKAAADEAARLGTPFVFGEMGAFVDSVGLNDYMTVFFRELEAHQGGAFLYDYSPGSRGVIDDDTGTPRAFTKVINRPRASAVAGDILESRYDTELGAYTLRWREDPSAGVSEILMPAWVRGGIYAIEVDGEAITSPEFDAKTRRLLISNTKKSGERTLRIAVQDSPPEKMRARAR